MDVLCLLATAIFTKEGGGDWPVLKPWSNQQDSSPELLKVEPNQRDLKDGDLNEPWNRVQELERRGSDIETRLLSDIETQPFLPTAVLEGEVILGISGIAGNDLDQGVVWQGSVELVFNTSFTGDDLLQVGFESGNAVEFALTDELTFEGRLSFPDETDNQRFEVSELSYEFPIGDRASVYVSTTGDDLDEFNPWFGDGSDGAISEFGTENPIYALVPDIGLQLNYDLTDDLTVSLGYFSDDAGNPEPGAGLFNGNHSAFVQLGFEPSDNFLLGLTYIHTNHDSSLETELGSLRSQINLERPVIGNSYGISALLMPSPRLAIGGWIGFTSATVLELGNAAVWNYALTVALPDVGKDGNLLGLVIGQEPRLTGTSGFTIDHRSSDPDPSLHLEVFYRDRLSDHISITPGLIWITAPNYSNHNPDIFVLTIRTTFKF